MILLVCNYCIKSTLISVSKRMKFGAQSFEVLVAYEFELLKEYPLAKFLLNFLANSSF